MSNVLIGIIGVILFIGLALAGAMILGTDFLTASSASKAATIVQGMQQASNAYAMNTIKTGATIPAAQGDTLMSTLIANKRLKSVPMNPFNPAAAGGIYGADDIGLMNPSKQMANIIMTLGPSTNKQVRDTCYAIEEQMGSSNPGAVDSPISFDVKGPADRRLGCLLNSFSGLYIAYVPL